MWDTNSTEMPTACKRRSGEASAARAPVDDVAEACFTAATYCDQIDEGHGVVVNAPQGHDANGVHGDHDDGQQVEETRAQVQAQQEAAHHEGGQQAEGDDGEALGYDGQVLLVEDVRDPGRAARGGPLTREQKRPDGLGGGHTYVYGNTSNAGSVPLICRMPRVMLWASCRAFSSAWVNSCELVRGMWYAMNREAGGDAHARHNTSAHVDQVTCLALSHSPMISPSSAMTTALS